MQGWEEWWAKAKAAKTARAKRIVDADISAYVAEKSGRRAGRAQVNHWLNRTREPTISQFMHLCDFLGLDPESAPWGIRPTRPKKAAALRGARASGKANGESQQHP